VNTLEAGRGARPWVSPEPPDDTDPIRPNLRQATAIRPSLEKKEAFWPVFCNTLNELTGAEWFYFTKSMLTTTYPSAHEQKLEYSIKE